jgi:hypothetical protein
MARYAEQAMSLTGVSWPNAASSSRKDWRTGSLRCLPEGPLPGGALARRGRERDGQRLVKEKTSGCRGAFESAPDPNLLSGDALA